MARAMLAPVAFALVVGVSHADPASASDRIGVALPSEEAAEAWEPTLARLGMHRAEPDGAAARVVDRAGRWVVEVDDGSGRTRSVSVTRPETESARIDLLLLIASLTDGPDESWIGPGALEFEAPRDHGREEPWLVATPEVPSPTRASRRPPPVSRPPPPPPEPPEPEVEAPPEERPAAPGEAVAEVDPFATAWVPGSPRPARPPPGPEPGTGTTTIVAEREVAATTTSRTGERPVAVVIEREETAPAEVISLDPAEASSRPPPPPPAPPVPERRWTAWVELEGAAALRRQGAPGPAGGLTGGIRFGDLSLGLGAGFESTREAARTTRESALVGRAQLELRAVELALGMDLQLREVSEAGRVVDEAGVPALVAAVALPLPVGAQLAVLPRVSVQVDVAKDRRTTWLPGVALRILEPPSAARRSDVGDRDQ